MVLGEVAEAKNENKTDRIARRLENSRGEKNQKIKKSNPFRDASTGAVVAALRGHSGAEPSSSSPHALALVGSSHVAAAQAGRGGVHFWSWRGGSGGKAGAAASASSSSSPSGRSFPAEPALSLASTRCGSLIAAGHASGSVSLWDSQGRLLRCWPAHYKRAAALAFSGDGAWLLTGGGDGGVSLWDVADVCDSGNDGGGGNGASSSFSSSSSSLPFRAWPSAHTLPVTCVAAGAGRVGPLAASASLDHSVVLYAATAGAMLRRVQLGSPCRCLCLEGGEHCLYVGCEDGNIYEVDLVGIGGGGGEGSTTTKRRRRDGGGGSGAGAGDSAALLPPGASALLSGHAGAVTALASPPAANSSLLVSGAEDGTVRVWDAASRATLRLLRHAAAASSSSSASTSAASSSSLLPPVVAVVALPVGVGPRGALSLSSCSSNASATPHLGREERPAPWESGAVSLTGLGAGGGPSVASSGLAGVAGVAEGSAAPFAAALTAPTAAAPPSTKGGEEEQEDDDDPSKLREQLASAREEASRWKALHARLLAETAADMA